MIYKCKYFKLQELVSPIVFNNKAYSENLIWGFFDADFLQDLDKIRERFGSAITINTWLFGGNTTQCGLRSNMDKMVKDKTTMYCSPHIMGKAVDLHAYDNVKLYGIIYKMIENGELKAVKRMEDRRSTKDAWVHIDCFQTNQILFT